MSTFKRAYKSTFQSLIKYPALLVPFIIFAAFELLALAIIYLAPRMPLRALLGPPIKTFFGEIYLHYPYNFLQLANLQNLSRMFLTVCIGSALSATVTAIVYDIYNKKAPALTRSLKTAFKKYIYLFLTILIVAFLLQLATKLVNKGFIWYFKSWHSWLEPLHICINFLLAIFIQSAFIFTIPLIIIGNEKLIGSMLKSIRLYLKLLIPTTALVAIPMLLYIPIIILRNNTQYLINAFFPESIVLLGILAIAVASLVIDPIVTISTTYLYLLKKEGLLAKTQENKK